MTAPRFKIRRNPHYSEPPSAPRTQRGNPSCRLESENLRSRVLDPDNRSAPSTKDFIRTGSLSALCVLGGSIFGSWAVRGCSLCLASPPIGQPGLGIPNDLRPWQSSLQCGMTLFGYQSVIEV